MNQNCLPSAAAVLHTSRPGEHLANVSIGWHTNADDVADLREFGGRCRGRGALLDERSHCLCVEVAHRDGGAGSEQPTGHCRAHLPETDVTEPHRRRLRCLAHFVTPGVNVMGRLVQPVTFELWKRTLRS